MTSRISAADNIVIEADAARWRMLINANFVENVQGDGLLMDVQEGQPLRYTPIFARTRHLPRSGELAAHYVQRVVLGWSWNDEAWHLGLVFEPSLAEARGSRWCELAKWPDPELDLYNDLAIQSGKLLAQILACPFNFIPVQQAAAPEAPPAPKEPPPLPIQLDTWQLSQQDNGWLVFSRNPRWQRERVRRVGWYSFWGVVYFALALASLNGDIALPRPEFLPYLGILTGLFLVGLVGFSVYELRNKPRQIVLDPSTHNVWGTLGDAGGKPLWRLSREQIDSVYASEVLQPQQGKPSVRYGELNLRMTNGKFFFLLSQEEPLPLSEAHAQDLSQHAQPVSLTELHTPYTPVQGMAAHLASGLNVPSWYDIRPQS